MTAKLKKAKTPKSEKNGTNLPIYNPTGSSFCTPEAQADSPPPSIPGVIELLEPKIEGGGSSSFQNHVRRVLKSS